MGRRQHTRRTRAVGRPSSAGLLAALTLAASGLAGAPAAASSSTVVSLTFNSGHVSQYTHARPVLQAHGVNATFYAASGWVDAGSNSSMGWSQLRTLYRDGNEVGGMGTNHRNLTLLDATAKQAEVCGDRQRLAAMGLDPRSFAYPAAAVDDTSRATVAGCGYLSGRTIGGIATTSSAGPWAETIPPKDAYAVRTANLPTGPISLSSLQTAVTTAAAKGGGWLPVSLSQVCRSGTAGYDTCMASSRPIDDRVLSDFLAWLRDGAPTGTTVRTVRQVMGAPPQPPLAADTTTVSLTFSDAHKTQYANAGPLLAARGMNATFYVPSGWVDKSFSATMPWWQIDDLYRAGHEIGGMGTDHKDLTTLDAATQQQQVCQDRERLQQQGYDPKTFAYPAGAHNATVRATVAGCGYVAARAAGGISTAGPTYAETLPPRDALAVRTTTVSSPVTLTELKSSVSAAAANGGGWLPIVLYQVCDAADSTYSTCISSYRAIDKTVLAGFLDWLDGGGAPSGTVVRSVRDALGVAPGPVLAARPVTVSITFDDASASQYKTLAPLRERGMRATYYVPTGIKQMSWAQLRELAAAGSDVGGHTADHVDLTSPSYSYDYKYRQVCDDRRRLIDNGINAQSFAYPYASYDSIAAGVVKACGHQSARRAGGLNPAGPTYAETIPPANPYVLRSLYRAAENAYTADELANAVAAASSHGGGWLVLGFHEICTRTAPDFAACMASYKPLEDTVFAEFLDWLASADAPPGTEVKTIAEVMGGGVVAPLVDVTTPASGARVGARPTVSGTADPAGGDVTVTFYAGSYPSGTPLQTLTTPHDSGVWTLTPASLPEGTVTATVEQTKSGVKGRSVPRTFGVSWAAPTVTLEAPSDGSVVRTATPRFSGSASDVRPAATVSVAVHAGPDRSGPLVQTLTAEVSADGRFDVSAAGALAHGSTYTAVASQTNDVGNTGFSAPVTFRVDTSGPTVVVETPLHGSVVGSSTPLIGGTASGDTTTARVDVYQGGTATGAVVQSHDAVVVDGRFSVSAGTLADGSYTVVAQQADSAGSIGTSPPVTFTVRTVAPEVSITAPTDGATIATATPSLAGTAGADATDVASVTVRVHAGSSTAAPVVQTLEAPVADGVWGAVVDALPDGDYSVQAAQSDLAGNIGRSPVTTFTVDTTGPTVAITAPAADSLLTSPTLSVAGTGGTAAGDHAVVVLDVHAGTSTSGTPVQSASSAVSDGGWSAAVAGLPDGTYTLVASQRDSAGNVSRTAGRTVRLGSSMVVASVSPQSVGQGASEEQVSLAGSGFSADVTVSLSGSGVALGTAAVTGSGSITVPVSVDLGAPTGRRDVIVSRAGERPATCTGCFTVNPGPRPTSAGPSALGQGATSQTVKIAGSGFVPGAVVSLSGPGVTATLTGTSSTQLTVLVSVAPGAATGSRDITVTQPDAGTGTCSGCFTVVAGPVISGISPAAVKRGASVTMTITGTGFDRNAKVTVNGSGINIGKVTWVSSTSLSVAVSALKNAATGPRTVTVTNPDSAGLGSCTGCLAVT